MLLRTGSKLLTNGALLDPPQLVEPVAEIPRAAEPIHGFDVRAAAVARPAWDRQRIERIDFDVVRRRVGAIALIEEKLAAQRRARHPSGCCRSAPISRCRRRCRACRSAAAETVVGERRLRIQHRDAPASHEFSAPTSPPACANNVHAPTPPFPPPAAWILVAAKRFSAEFEIGIRRRDPARLHAVVAVLVGEKRLIRQRSIDESCRYACDGC